MPRHNIAPLPRALNGRKRDNVAGGSGIGRYGREEDVWAKMDRVQVLGGPPDGGHRGCVNALSWSDDGATLLSGSDDKRICIWAPDETPPSNSLSPHPMKLKDTIITGHRANIFSAKYLPNTSTPTIVSCAGDRVIRVFEVERLGRADLGGMGRGTSELWGGDGDGVRVLSCHHDRTKRIATENSPFLFLTVSEDGTVRQHDLRRPHRCRSECPEPLFRAPRGVDLYSLSVSTVAPHTFAVAGRTDCAFICDRRMLERQTPSWGPHVKASGQVHCVRRLGLSEEDWRSVEPRAGSMYSGERHITCVKMSPDRADEVICAFARHSTSLFSLYDSPGTTSMRARSASPQIGTAKRRKSPLAAPHTPVDSSPRSLTGLNAPAHLADGKSQFEPGGDVPTTTLGGVEEDAEGEDEDEDDDAEMERELEATFQSYRERLGLTSQPTGRTADEWAEIADQAMNEDEEVDTSAEPTAYLEPSRRRQQPRVGIGPIELSPTAGPSRSVVRLPTPPAYEPSDLRGLPIHVGSDESMWVDEEDDMDMDDDRDDANRAPGPSGIRIGDTALVEEGDSDADTEEADLDMDDDMLDETDLDDDDDDDDHGFDDMDMFDEEDDDDDDDDEDEDGEDGMYADPRSAEGEFGAVPLVLPRRSYKGARNQETVKDCNFLGTRADKVCSGSDDGSWFLWDRDTGRLEGLWEGDGDVVNVMEQHPTLPIVAVSGIDNTVKLFAPPAHHSPSTRSYSRLSRADEIIRRNTAQRSEFRSGAAGIGHADLLRFLQSRGIVVSGMGPQAPGAEGEVDEDEEAGVQQCATQ